MMRPFCLAVSLLLFIFLSSVQGIRLEESFKSAGHPKILHEASSNGVIGEVIVCKEGQCSGNSRKLFTAMTSTSTTTSKREGNYGESKANPTSKVKSSKEGNGEKQEKFPDGSPTTSKYQEYFHDQYANFLDIAEMDYSPDRRKPPIQN